MQKLVELFGYWQTKNYGYLSKCFDETFFGDKEVKKHPAECRDKFSDYSLSNWEFLEIEERACGLTKVKVYVTYDFGSERKTVNGDIIIYYGNANSEILALPWRNNGEWKVTVFNII